MKKKIISISGMLVAIILMIIPFGVKMTFAPSATEHETEYFSYFSTLPLGYGNWFPIITAVLSIFVFVLLIVGFRKTKMKIMLQVFLFLCIVAMTLSWIIFSSFSIISLCIMIIHIVVFLLQFYGQETP